MKRWMAVLLTVAGIAGPAHAYAQEVAQGPARVEISIIPGGGLFFTKDKDTNEPGFGNYDLGGAVAVNFNRYVGSKVKSAARSVCRRISRWAG
jgi:hypothetical protein